MAPAYISIWTRCLQELQHLPEVLGNPAEEHAAAARISAELTKWLALPVLSASAWQALVAGLEVRRRKPPLLMPIWDGGSWTMLAYCRLQVVRSTHLKRHVCWCLRQFVQMQALQFMRTCGCHQQCLLAYLHGLDLAPPPPPLRSQRSSSDYLLACAKGLGRVSATCVP